jgi:hypothetical protein
MGPFPFYSADNLAQCIKYSREQLSNRSKVTWFDPLDQRTETDPCGCVKEMGEKREGDIGLSRRVSLSLSCRAL